MPKVHVSDVIKYIIQGFGEDFTHKRAVAGVGKWNDMVVQKKKKEQPKAKTPPRMTLDPDRIARDIERKKRELEQAKQY